MSIFDSQIAPYLIVLSVIVVLAGFFRRLLLGWVGLVLFEIVLFALFPVLLIRFANLIGVIHKALFP